MSIFKGRIKVVCPDNMVFPVNAETLEPESCSLYDPYPYSVDESDKIISYGAWLKARALIDNDKGGD